MAQFLACTESRIFSQNRFRGDAPLTVGDTSTSRRRLRVIPELNEFFRWYMKKICTFVHLTKRLFRRKLRFLFSDLVTTKIGLVGLT